MTEGATPKASSDDDVTTPVPTADDATVVRPAGAVAPAQFPPGLTTRELAHALRGEVLDHFHLQEFVGGGGMGVVFRALDTTLDRVVAVKVVASHQLSGEDLQRRFLVEAQSTARLDHPNIARVHYIGRDLGLPYIVFEYIDGVNIRDLVATGGPLSLQDALSYTYQIAHALAHAWQRDVVHRDIKPSNILVAADGQAKLVDMGLARLTLVDAPDDDLTATGVTLGTFDYISPEQARDARDADTRSDIYSLGCTLYYMLVGAPPFSSERAVQKLLAHQSEPPPDVRTLRPDAPEPVTKLLDRMLAKSPDDRPSDPIELADMVWRVADQLNVALPTSLAPLPWTSRPARPAYWKRHVAWIAPVLLAIALAPVVDRWLAGDAANGQFGEFQHPQAPRGDSAADGVATANDRLDSEAADPSTPLGQSLSDDQLSASADSDVGDRSTSVHQDEAPNGTSAADLAEESSDASAAPTRRDSTGENTGSPQPTQIESPDVEPLGLRPRRSPLPQTPTTDPLPLPAFEE